MNIVNQKSHFVGAQHTPHSPGNLPWSNFLVQSALASIVLMMLLSVAGLTWHVVSPVGWYGFGIGIDRLTMLLSLLVGSVGAVAFRYSINYLKGNPRRGRFLTWMWATVTAAYGLMICDHLLLLWLAWFATSIGLHQLLTFYKDRPQANIPARKKFLISRLGDFAMLGAIALIGWHWETLQLHLFLGRLTSAGEDWIAGAVAALIALAALTKSAQFPFHSWLPETMESPTPVSALMHAGIINAGGALLLRMSPLILNSAVASSLLLVIGTMTLCLGLVATWAQVKIKRTLAWSTVGQMGFMMVQCGMGVFAAAALHMIGHGFYKAYAFLRSGEVPPASLKLKPSTTTANLIGLGVGIIISTVALTVAVMIVGLDIWQSPGEFALILLLGLALAQVWVGVMRSLFKSTSMAIGVGLSLTFAAAIGTVSLYHATNEFLHPVLAIPRTNPGTWVWLMATLPVVAVVILTVIHACLPTLANSGHGRTFYVHCLNGFYIGTLADRWVAKIWPDRRIVTT